MAKKNQPVKKNTKPSQYDWFKNGSQPTGKASPKGSFKMPELKSERSKKYLANFEYELEKLSIASNSSSMKGLDYV